MNIVVEVDSKEVRAAFNRAPAVVRMGITKWITKTAYMTEREAKLHVRPRVDTGQLQSSIHTLFTGHQAIVKPTAKHAKWVHQGRRPGRMPPFQEGTSLNSWARRRGANPFLVARGVARKGIKPHPFMDDTYRIIRPRAEQDARGMLAEIVRGI